ncbi:hypothetical protein [Francisella salimarina]|uniref:hypothetical protein n=1 Tax=Francisella salimarina TaxID=2599927 RepID=UPI003751D801
MKNTKESDKTEDLSKNKEPNNSNKIDDKVLNKVSGGGLAQKNADDFYNNNKNDPYQIGYKYEGHASSNFGRDLLDDFEADNPSEADKDDFNKGFDDSQLNKGG